MAIASCVCRRVNHRFLTQSTIRSSPNAAKFSTPCTPSMLPLGSRRRLQPPCPTKPVGAGHGLRSPIRAVHNPVSTTQSLPLPPARLDENTRVGQVVAVQLPDQSPWHSSTSETKTSGNGDKYNHDIISPVTHSPAMALRRRINISTRITSPLACIGRLTLFGQRCCLRQSLSSNNDPKTAGRDVLVQLMPDHRFLRIEPPHLSTRRAGRKKNAGSVAAETEADPDWNSKTDIPPTLWNQGVLNGKADYGHACMYSLGSARLKWVPTLSKVATERSNKTNTQSEAGETAVLLSARGILALTAPSEYEGMVLERALSAVMKKLCNEDQF